jgi:hypothetical protein
MNPRKLPELLHRGLAKTALLACYVNNEMRLASE